MQRQTHACAFSNACSIEGPRVRMEGTNKEYCRQHAQSLQGPAVGSSIAPEAFSSFVSGGGRRSDKRKWDTYAGVVVQV